MAHMPDGVAVWKKKTAANVRQSSQRNIQVCSVKCATNVNPAIALQEHFPSKFPTNCTDLQHARQLTVKSSSQKSILEMAQHTNRINTMTDALHNENDAAKHAKHPEHFTTKRDNVHSDADFDCLFFSTHSSTPPPTTTSTHMEQTDDDALLGHCQGGVKRVVNDIRRPLRCDLSRKCFSRKVTSVRQLRLSRPFMILVVAVAALFTSFTRCDTQLSSVTFPYASSATFPNMPPSIAPSTASSSASSSQLQFSSSSSPAISSSLSTPLMSSTTVSAHKINSTPTIVDLLQSSSTRQAPATINFQQFCGMPPVIANAQSNLMRNQKHHVFPLGQVATYVCDQGYRPVVIVGDRQQQQHPLVNTTRCMFVPNTIPTTASNVIFPDSTLHETLRSGRAKNSKRLIEIDEEPDANHASPNRVTAVQFPDKNSKSGRSEDFVYDTSPEAFLSGRNSDLDNDSEVLERKKQKIEKTVRNGQLPVWYPEISLKCERVTCDDPGEVEHSTRKVSEDGFVFNSNVFYECASGYETVGVPILTCRANGSWNRSPPKCVLKQCSPLPSIENGRILYNDERKIDSQAEYHCSSGYKLNSPVHVRQCRSDLTWTDSVPLVFIPNPSVPEVNDPFRCSPVECPTPVRPHSGLRILNASKKKKFLPGDMIIYACSTINSRGTAKCQDNGEWSREPPHCPPLSSKCPTLPHFPHGRVEIDNNRAYFTCFEGYELEGSRSITCLSKGIWNDTISQCLMKGMNSNSIELPANNTSAEAATDVEAQIKSSSSSRTVTMVVVAFFVVFAVVTLVGATFFCRWRQNKLQRKRWQQYFGHYHHRQSKTNIVMNRSQGGSGGRGSTGSRMAKRPRAGSNATSTQAFLQSSFSSADEQNADTKSVQTGAGTLTSEQARTMSTFADDCTTTCADDDFEDYEEAENELENLYVTSATILASDAQSDAQPPQEPMIQLSTPETQSKQPHERPSSVLLDPLYSNYPGPSSSSTSSRPVPAPRVLGPKPSPAVPVTDL